jgi:hypothetical protein
MTKKAVKAEDVVELVNNDDRVIDAIFSRLEQRLTTLVENVIDKWATTMNKKLEILLEERVKKISGDLAEMASENKHLRRRVEDLETYSRLDNLIINGLPSDFDQLTTHVTDEVDQITDPSIQSMSEPTRSVLYLFNSYMKLDVRQHDIAKIHYMKSKSGARSILLKFANRRPRDLVLQARPKLKNLPNNLRIYINEHLSPTNASIFATARDRVKKNSYTLPGPGKGRSTSKRPAKFRRNLNALQHWLT